MRFTRITFWGGIANILYFSTVTVRQFQLLYEFGRIHKEAESLLGDANRDLVLANNAYQAALSNLSHVQQQIDDANCYVNNYANFSAGLYAYCNPILTDDPLHDLTANYGLDVIVKRPVLTATRCILVHSKLLKDCDERNSFKYPVAIRVRLSSYGVSVVGDGTNLLLNCGSYLHGIVVSANEYIKKSTIAHKFKNSYESITDTYATTGNVRVIIDSIVNKTVNYEINPDASNFQSVASNLILEIFRMCEFLNHAMQPPQKYSDILLSNQATFATLNASVERLLSKYQYVINQKNKQQEHFDFAHHKIESLLLQTLMSSFVQLLVIGLIIRNEHLAKSKNYNGYTACGADLSWMYNKFRTCTKRQQAPQGARFEELANQDNSINDSVVDLEENSYVNETTRLKSTHKMA